MKMRPGLCLLLLLLTAVSTPADSVDEYVRSEMARRHIPGLSLVVVKNKNNVWKLSGAFRTGFVHFCQWYNADTYESII